MPLYESTFIARQDLSKQDVQRLTDEFGGIIANNGGKVVKSEYWGLRNLAYRIKKNRKGHYSMLAIDAPAPALKEMERIIGINEEVIRLLTVRVEEISKDQSPILSNRREDYVDPLADDVIAAV